jgi:hypothetical protein
MELPLEIREALNKAESIKLLVTASPEGEAHAAFKDSMALREDGLLEYDEIIETSRSNRNMLHSLWFKKKITVALLYAGRSFLIKGLARRSIISGQKFKESYLKNQEKNGDMDMSAVWLIEPVEWEETSLGKRASEEERAHPLLRHLDRLLLQE